MLSPALRKMVSQANNKYASSGNGSVKPKEGRNIYRIVWAEQAPWIGEDGKFWADLGVHWIKATKEGKPSAVVGDCDICFQQPSPIRAAVEAAIASASDTESKELFESWQARPSVLLNVLDRTGGANPTETSVLELSTTTYGKVMALVELYLESGQNILDPVEGLDICITRSGTGLNTKYDVTANPGKPLPVPQAVIDNATDLNLFIQKNFFRGEEQKALNAIAQISGVAIPRLENTGTATPTAALTSSAASVAPDPEPTPAPATPVAETVVQTTVAPDPAAARRAEILAQQAAAEAELEALNAQAAAADAAPVEEATSAMSDSEQDAILAELEGLSAK